MEHIYNEKKMEEGFILTDNCFYCGKPVVGFIGQEEIRHDCGVVYRLKNGRKNSLSDHFNDRPLK